ncbi:hypothetical protein EPO15_13235 [bacterium]|nr:MAG: hypothetical protein EPO15_13235 [bacterium]
MKTKNAGHAHLPAAALAAALLIPSAAAAQTCRVYCPDGSSFLQQCDDLSDPCVGTGGGRPWNPPAPVDPRPAQRQRFEALVPLAQGEDASLAGRPLSTDAEFSSALHDLHVALTRTVVVSRARRGVYDALRNVEETKYQEYYRPRFALVDSSDGLVVELKQARREAQAVYEEADARLKGFAAVRDGFLASDGPHAKAESLLRDEARLTKLAVLAHLGGLSPAEAGADVETAEVPVPAEPSAPYPVQAVPWYLGSIYLPNQAAERAVEEARDTLAVARMRALPSIGGDIETRLAFGEKMAGEAGSALQAARAAEAAYRQASQANANAARHWAITTSENMDFWQATQSLRYGAVQAEYALRWTHEALKSDIARSLWNARAATAWKAFRVAYLYPEAKRISKELFDGKPYMHGDTELNTAWKYGAPLVAPSIKAYSRQKQVASLQKLAKRLEGSFEEKALATAEVLANGNPKLDAEAYDTVFTGAGGEIRDEVRTVLDETGLPAAFRSRWRQYFVGN